MNTDGHKDIPNEIIFPLGEAAISSNVIAEVSGTKAKIEKAISDSKVAREHSNFNDHTKREAELHAEATGEANMKIDSMQYAREIFLRKYPGCRPLLHSHTERWEDFLKLAEDA